nr:MAG TPA: tail protein [Caudoviricetes sp.]
MSKGYTLTPSGPMPVKQLHTLTGGKAYPVDKAYTLTGGTARLWYQRGTPLGSLAVGSTVKIAVGGTDYDWLVVHQGLPGSMYDASCNGVWVVMKDIYTKSKFGSTNLYKNSGIHTYLNGTFYNLIDSQIRAVIKQVKIPYTNSGVQSGANGLSTKVFLLSGTEVGISSTFMNTEGTKLSYFDSASKRVAYNGGSAAAWWLRSPLTTTSANVWCVGSDGSSAIRNGSDTCGARPCMILPQDALVDDTGHIIGTDDPRTPLGWHSVGSTIKMDINGNKRVWRIAYKGNPNPNLYDESCNGVWLVLNTIYSTRANGSDCQYAGGTIDTYLNSTFLKRIDKDGNAAKYIKDVKIPYAKKQGDGSWEVQTKENGLPCKVFLPSIFELGGAENLSIYKDGSKLGYYDGSAATLTLKQSGTPAPWRTRTVTSDAQSEFSVDANGTITTCAPTDVIGVVPCVIMKPDALVEDGIIVGE